MKPGGFAVWVLIAAGTGLAAGDIVAEVRTAIAAHNFTLADRDIQAYRMSAGITPPLLEALSWLARATLDTKQYALADKYATETRQLSLEFLNRAGKGDASVVTALGAAIEVHAQALAARGQRTEAVAYLKGEIATWKDSPLASRIQKNINLLSMEGKPAPPLDESHWLGTRPQTLAALKGHPVLLFFWAHWCVDCKAEVPVLARLMQTYGPKGLVLVGPTQLYGYTADSDAAPDVETRYIDQIRQQYYAPLGNMAVPVSTQNFDQYGCSTTPTLVLLDRGGVVRMYHPGAMTYEALADQVKRFLSVPAARS